jgi:hypothetical protein
MLYVVIEEIWSISPLKADRKLLRLAGTRAAGDRAEMMRRAREFASKFDYHNSETNAIYPYWWGRDEGEQTSHRYVVRPVGGVAEF